jgi:acyl carrier protein
MGLDIVELVMRCEEDFGITIADADAEQMHTVGDLYLLVCRQLGIEPAKGPLTPVGLSRPVFGSLKPSPRIADGDEVWAAVVRIVVDQLQVEESDVRYDARFQEDLGCD